MIAIGVIFGLGIITLFVLNEVMKQRRKHRARLVQLLKELTALIRKEKDARTEEVRQFILQHENVREFRDLALTLVIMYENRQHLFFDEDGELTEPVV